MDGLHPRDRAATICHRSTKKRSELIVDNGLAFARERLVVPISMRKEMLTQIHRSHIGIEGCLWRAREVLYWPLMNAEVKGLRANALRAKRISQHNVVKN